jgi:hypothetical protein
MVDGGRDWVPGAVEVSTRGLSSSAAAVEEGGRWVEGGAAEDEGRREAIGKACGASKDQPGSKKLEESSPGSLSGVGVVAKPAEN